MTSVSSNPANDTRTQIDSIQALINVVEGHVKTTQTDISTTSNPVGEIDAVKKSLGG